jgi:hypothetical protein
MMHTREPRPVIAGMDGSGSSRRAVEFATAHRVLHRAGCPVAVVPILSEESR